MEIIVGIVFIVILIKIFSSIGIIFHSNKRPAKTYIDDYGYRRFIDSDKLVHRWVMEKELGRKLRWEEVVHHKNRNKLDNSPDNLELFANQEEHQRHHDQTDFLFKMTRKVSRGLANRFFS